MQGASASTKVLNRPGVDNDFPVAAWSIHCLGPVDLAIIAPVIGNHPGSTGERSVIKALLPTKQPTAPFWVGLGMVAAGLIGAVCPLLLDGALFLGQEANAQDQLTVGALTLSACFTLLLFAPGVILVAVGRPRR